MTVAKNRAELLARARVALGDDEFAGEIRVRGTGEVRGVPVRWARNCHASGSFVETVDGAIGHAVGYDGRTGWRVDETGQPGPLELDDLEDAIVAVAVWSGRWVRGAVVVEDRVALDGERLVATLRADATATRRYRLTLDAATCLPRRLEPIGRDDVAIELDEFRPGGFGRVPHVTRLREAWLTDTLRVAAVERTTEASPCTPPGEPPRDLEIAAEPPPTWRRTRRHVPLVRAAIDGGDAGWFVLDTGASGLAIAERVAAERALPELGRRIVRTSDGVAGAPYRTAQTLRIGPATLRHPRFLELDLAAFSQATGVALAGILGRDLFLRAVIAIDPEAGVAITAGAPDGGDWVDVRFQDGCPVIAARLPGPSGPCDGLLALDTGSAAAVTLAAGVGPQVALRGRGRIALRGVSGSAGARAGELDWLELGGHRLDDVAVVVAPSGAGATGDPTPAPRVLGHLGMAVLRHFTVTFDYPRRRVRLHRTRRAVLRARPPRTAG